MDSQVVANRYIQLQRALFNEQQSLKEQFLPHIKKMFGDNPLNREVPVLMQLPRPIPIELYRASLQAVSHIISDNEPHIKQDIYKLISELSDQQADQWIKAAIKYEMTYFHNLAKKQHVSDWLPHFLAEQAFRPFAQGIAHLHASIMTEFNVMGTCPCCGEPPRLGKVTRDQKTSLACPRCETQWYKQRLACVHCGDDKEENTFHLTIKEDESVHIEICSTCNNYLKLIDRSSYPETMSASLLDLQTIHLDFAAQEEGFGDDNY
ncbi:formate dehydrogenase accessory protein FdhE [Salipaludibacillus agaradhaerens]|uniref:Formate dehydrogenase accessory protein FdhE n=1 Tax=Salipaludibacillus agaradhaerens TaxID=76935 RepID=A0A9Q4AZ90_SALAG|nr:formate dehydrogenase accessory protein FdhE [Salipaludibacillus agaradhaerens]MCR6095399.1 formate dehydrogenase accessory protein FdhE [Salipaludibacillus agaradhaerens]MCR6115043.1 formate dehydrogenase accessory protein FdhE [Salipaludibacillus agaradhaerens]